MSLCASKERIALDTLFDAPAQPICIRAGDMYLTRCGVVLVLGHKRGMRRVRNAFGRKWIWLYHFDRPSLMAWSGDLCDGTAGNGSSAEDFLTDQTLRKEPYRYIGNLFDRLPWHALVS